MSDRLCKQEGGKAPSFCPTRKKTAILETCLAEYGKAEVSEFARQASIQEGEGYGGGELGYARVKPLKPRIEETIEFAKKMGYGRIGLAFCIGLREEARVIEQIFSDRGFHVISVICKVGRIPKETIDVREAEKIVPGTEETMCNPVMQAQVLNDEKTDLNVALGLCVGHDSLFFRYSKAPCTVLAVKDRLLGHNPLAAVYTVNSYYRALK